MEAIYILLDKKIFQAKEDLITIINKKVYENSCHQVLIGTNCFQSEEAAEDFCLKKYGPDYADTVLITSQTIWKGSIPATYS